MQCSFELAECPVAVAEIGRCPSATHQGNGRPWIASQRALYQVVSLANTMCKADGASGEGKCRAVFGSQPACRFRQSTGAPQVLAGSRAEALRGPLSPAPSGHCLSKTVVRSQLLRPLEVFQRSIALIRCHGECGRHGTARQTERLVIDDIEPARDR